MPLNQSDLERLRTDVLEVVLEAGQKVMDIYNKGFEVTEKEDESPVTSADLASNRLIMKSLERISPSLPSLSEESAHLPFSIRSQWPAYWLIDPLDGTKEFIKHNGEFTVNVALIQGKRPVLGVVYAPALGLVYYAMKGEGAFKVDRGKHMPIHVRPLGAGKPTILGSRSHLSTRFEAYLDRVGDHDLIRIGSSIKFCLIAEGEADLYPRFGPTSEWDTAAGQCVLEAAGGRVTDMNMRPLLYNTKASLENPDFFAFGDASRNWKEGGKGK
jgi:3'(2'), 5'-bisphosphate nucleotidase